MFARNDKEGRNDRLNWIPAFAGMTKGEFTSAKAGSGNNRVVHRDKMARILKNWSNQGLLIQIIPPSGFVKGTKYKLADSSEGVDKAS